MNSRDIPTVLAALLLLSGAAAAQTITTPGGRDASGNKVPAAEIYCRLPSGRSAPCGPDSPLAITTIPGTSSEGGLKVFRVFSPAGSPAMTVKAEAGRLYSFNLCNTAGASRFVRFYNTPTAQAGSTPVYAGPVVVSAGSCQQFTTSFGLAFPSGISMSITAAMGDMDTSPITTGDVTGFLGYE